MRSSGLYSCAGSALSFFPAQQGTEPPLDGFKETSSCGLATGGLSLATVLGTPFLFSPACCLLAEFSCLSSAMLSREVFPRTQHLQEACLAALPPTIHCSVAAATLQDDRP